MQLWSVGHSTHPLDAFVALLAANGIEVLADIRAVPRSRRSPHFDTDALRRALPERGVRYRHLARLGGWRRPLEESPNAAWRNPSFRGYADYALTEEFAAGLAELHEIASAHRAAMMCSEALWWKCHRRLVADRLVAAGHVVWHIGPTGGATTHRLPAFATVGPDGRVTYPATS